MSELAAVLSSYTLAPASENEEIMQNVRTLISTPLGTAPLHREVGIRQTAVDAPSNRAQAQIAADVVDVVGRYESRAEVESVTFTSDLNGRLTPKVRIKKA